MTLKSDIYNIYAHQSHVADLPEDFLKRLLNTFFDKSYGDDECSSFAKLHEDGDKAYHLWIDAKEQKDRCEESEFRFIFALAEVSPKYDKTNTHDFLNYIDIGNNRWEWVFSELDELIDTIVEEIPNF